MPSEAQIIGGHKANLHNPNTSAEAKEHSKEVLKEDFNGKNRHPSSSVKLTSTSASSPTCFSVC